LDEIKRTLTKGLEWRKKYKPENLRLKDLTLHSKNMVFQYGMDKTNHPVMYIVLRNDDIENDEKGKMQKFDLFVYAYEVGMRLMTKPVTSLTLIVELKGGTISISMAKAMKAVLDDLGEYYPEMASKIIVLNLGFFMQGLWTFLKGLLPKHVIEKYIFPSDIQKDLLKIIDDNELAFYGSKGDKKIDAQYFIDMEKKLFPEDEKVEEKTQEEKVEEKTEEKELTEEKKE
jgi:hypothetical protein